LQRHLVYGGQRRLGKAVDLHISVLGLHSSFCSIRTAPIRRLMASSLGKIPTKLARRLTSLFRRSVATARKLSVLIWHMLTKQQERSFIFPAEISACRTRRNRVATLIRIHFGSMYEASVFNDVSGEAYRLFANLGKGSDQRIELQVESEETLETTFSISVLVSGQLWLKE
jgi:hypothetical protein